MQRGKGNPSGFSGKSAVATESKTVLRSPGRRMLYSKPSEKPKLQTLTTKPRFVFFVFVFSCFINEEENAVTTHNPHSNVVNFLLLKKPQSKQSGF